MVSYRRTYLLSNLLRLADNPGFQGKEVLFVPRSFAAILSAFSFYFLSYGSCRSSFCERLNWALRFYGSVLNRESTFADALLKLKREKRIPIIEKERTKRYLKKPLKKIILTFNVERIVLDNYIFN